jgi:hypothetical protein
VPLDAADKAAALAELDRILDDYAAVKASVYATLFDVARFTRVLTEPGSDERAALTEKYLTTLARMRDDESIFKTERLYTAIGKMRFERIDDQEAEISDALKDEVRALVRWADETTTDVYERQTVINGASNVLEEAGMDEEGKALLLAELEKSKQPYYFMVGIADIEQAAGNYEAALGWLKRAYDEATGPATRFQWGTYYVAGLVDMAPDDAERIRDAVMSVIGEIEDERAFYQRPKRYLRRMESKLEAWNEGDRNRDSIVKIRDGVRRVCMTIPAEDSARATCESFLETA